MGKSNLESIQKELLKALLEGDDEKSIGIAKDTISQGASPLDFFEEVIGPSLSEIGDQFEKLAIFLPEMIEAAEIVDAINTDVIVPAVEASSEKAIEPKGKVVLATIQGDLHDIGKSMVALMLKVNGFQVIDMGINVQPADIVERTIQEKADIVGMSSLLTTCLPYMKDLVDNLEARGVRNDYGVIIGGAAPTPEFAKQIGVDAQGHSAAEALTICNKIMESR